MAITLRTAGTWVAITGNSAVTLPTHQAGDMLIVRVACKSTNASTNTITISTSGWTKIGQGSNGTTNSGNGSGSVIVAAFFKVAESSSETDPTVEFSVSASPGAVVAMAYQKASGEMWISPQGNSGPDTTSNTSHSATIASHVRVYSGDLVDFFTGIADDTTMTVPTFTQAGATLNTVTESPANALSSTTGNDISADGGYRTCTSGTSTAAAVVTGTLSSSETGTSWVSVLRVMTPPPTGQTQARIKVVDINNHGQAQATIRAVGVNQHGQAQARVKQTYTNATGQVQAYIHFITIYQGAAETVTSDTSIIITIPPHAVGDRLIFLLSSDGADEIFTWPSEINPTSYAETSITSEIAYKDVTGAEGWNTAGGSTIEVTVSSAEQATCAIVVIKAGYFDPQASPQTSAASSTTSTSPNPLIVSPSWGSADNIYIAFASYDIGDSLITKYPTEYIQGVNYSSDSTGTGVGVATKIATSSSEDPDTFTINASRPWITWTIAVRPLTVGYTLATQRGQAQAQIKNIGLPKAQSQGSVIEKAHTGFANAKINSFDYGRHAQAQARVNESAATGLARGYITKTMGHAQTGAAITRGVYSWIDTFDRSNAESLGNADSGGEYAYYGNSVNQSVNQINRWKIRDNEGIFTNQYLSNDSLGVANLTPTDYVGIGSKDVLLRFKCLSINSNINTTIALRVQGYSSTEGLITNESSITLSFTASAFNKKYAIDSSYNLDPVILGNISDLQIAEEYSLRGQVFPFNDGSVGIRLKFWKSSDTEPGWQLSAQGTDVLRVPRMVGGATLLVNTPVGMQDAVTQIAFTEIRLESSAGWAESGQAQAEITTTRTILLVVADKTALTSTDTNVRDTITGLGYSVTLASDEDAVPSLTGIDAIVIAESVVAATLDTKYRNVAKPILVLDNTPAVNMDLMTGGPNLAGQTQVDVTNTSHTASAGKSGTVTVFSSSVDLRYAETSGLGAGVSVYLSVTGNSSQAVGFTYDSGSALLNSHTAEDKRAVLHLFYEVYSGIQTADAYDFLEAAILWLFEEPGVTETYVHGQAQAQIKQTYYGLGQAQGTVKQTYFGLGQAQAWVENTYYGLGQSQAWIENTYFGLGQAQGTVKQTYTDKTGQAQARIKNTYFGLGQANADIKQTYTDKTGQAQAQIKNTYFGLGQSQARIKNTYFGLGQAQGTILRTYTDKTGQAQAQIKNTYFGLGQSQAQIKRTYTDKTGQAQGTIKTTYFAHGQAQAQIKQVYFGLGQAQSWIEQTYNQHGQAQARIKNTYFGLGQAQASIVNTYFALGQSQAWIEATVNSHGQAQGRMLAFGVNQHGQAHAVVEAIYFQYGQAAGRIKGIDVNAHGQSQAWIKTTYYAHGQSQGTIKTTYFVHGQAQADIKQTYFVHGQSQGWIENTYNQHGQAQGTVKSTYFGLAQAQAWIEQTYNSHGQCQAQIKQTYVQHGQTQGWVETTYNQHGQAQGQIKQTYNVHAQSQAIILATYYQHGQSQGWIENTYNGHGQSQAWIENTYFGLGQAQGWIENTYYGLGQAQGQIKAIVYVHAQAQAKINAFGVCQHGQAQGQVGALSQAYAQAQAKIKAIDVNAHGQPQADIKQTYNSHGQAQGTVKTTYFVHGQAQAAILQTYYAHGQAQAQIKQTYYAHAQAQATILATYFVHAQAQAKINAYDINCYGQAQGYILAGKTAHGQAQCYIKAIDICSHGQTQGQIKQIYTQHGQSQADIKTTYYVHGQVNALIANTYFVHGQSQGWIKAVGYGLGQCQVDIKQTYTNCGQVQGWIEQTYYVHAQAQGYIILLRVGTGQAQADIEQTYNQYGQTQGAIKQTYNSHANAQAWIEVTVNNYAQAQGLIVSTSQAYGQAQANVISGLAGYGQAQGLILQTYFVHAQAQAFTVKAALYGQAQALIRVVFFFGDLEVSDSNPIDLSLSDSVEPGAEIIDQGKPHLTLSDSTFNLELSDENIDLTLSDTNY